MKYLAFILILMAGCASKPVSPVADGGGHGVARPTSAVPPPPPPAPANFTNKLAGVSAADIQLPPPPPLFTCMLAWDVYTDPSASQLFVLGSASFAGPYTNILTISPPNAQSNCVVVSTDPQHFYRLAVQ